MHRAISFSLYLYPWLAAIVNANVVSEGVVKLDTRHKHVLRHSSEKSKRDDIIQADFTLNEQWVFQGSYFIDIEVGTPAQKLELLLDTGSANFYLPSSKASKCQQYLCPGDATADSSTFETVKTPLPLRLEYVDGSTVNGSYVSDTVTVAGAQLDNFVFAITSELQVSHDRPKGPQYGIMGVSYAGAESSICGSAYYNVKCNVNFTTPTIPEGLYDGGYIKSRSYSLYLDHAAARSGGILFGGVDTEKFTGDLVTLGVPTNTRPNDLAEGIWVYQGLYLTGVSGKVNGTTTKLTSGNYSSTVIIDSGNTQMGLPPSIFKQIAPYLPVQEVSGSYFVDCKDVDNVDASIVVSMSGTNDKSIDVEVPLANFVIPIYEGNYNSTTVAQAKGEDVCIVGMYPDSNNYSSFGDRFLRSVYAFHDLDAHTLSLAQASYDKTGSNIIPVGSGEVPSFAGTGKSTPPSGPPALDSSPTPSGNAGVSMQGDSMLLSAISAMQ